MHFNVESAPAPLEPISVISTIGGLIGAGAGAGNLYIKLASSGCWPKTINSQEVLGEFHQIKNKQSGAELCQAQQILG